MYVLPQCTNESNLPHKMIHQNGKNHTETAKHSDTIL